MAVFSCQLKKLEAEKKTYEVATEKLLQFAEVQLFPHFVWPSIYNVSSN